MLSVSIMCSSSSNVVSTRNISERFDLKRKTRVSRCLFGKTDPKCDQMFKEEFERNRERFIKRWGYDVLEERFINDDREENQEETLQENINITYLLGKSLAENQSSKTAKKVLDTSDVRMQPYLKKQSYLTDYWGTKRHCHNPTNHKTPSQDPVFRTGK